MFVNSLVERTIDVGFVERKQAVVENEAVRILKRCECC